MNQNFGQLTLPKLKLKVEYVIIGYLIDELTDEEFKERIQSILDEFEGKDLLHRNIGQLTWEWEKGNRGLKTSSRRFGVYLNKLVHELERTSILREDAEVVSDQL